MIRLVNDRRGIGHTSLNIKEGFQFVKLFKVDVRNMLKLFKVSMISRGFIYTCLPYLNFPTNTVIINGQSPNNDLICEEFGIGKSKLYEVYKELECLEIIKRMKINGQWIIYVNPFLHSGGLVSTETYEIFKTSIYNPDNRDHSYELPFKEIETSSLNFIAIKEEKVTEKDLELMLMKDLSVIENGMTPIKNQYQVKDGFIDILARDKNDTLCIIELKISNKDMRLIEQCVYYPTQFNEDLRFISIAPDYESKLSTAIKSLGYVEMKTYTIEDDRVKIHNFN